MVTLLATRRPNGFKFTGWITYVDSTTTWTNFDTILTPSPPRVDKCGHSTYPPPVHVDKRGKKDTPPMKYSMKFNVM